QSLRNAFCAIEQQGDAALAVRRRVSMFRGENVDDRNGLAGKLLQRGRERAAACEQLGFAFGVATLADHADIAPQIRLVGDGRLLEGSEVRSLKIGLYLFVFHSREEHLTGGTGVKRSTNAEIRSAAHGMKPFDEIDVNPEIPGLNRQDHGFICFVADFPHYWK